MLTSATVENFRGIERLHVDGLGRVNLIIGRNDSGKTALMEALALTLDADDAARVLAMLQTWRSSELRVENFEDCWRPLFRRLDVERGFWVDSTDSQGARVRLEVRKAASAPRATTADIRAPFSHAGGPWALEYTVTRQEAPVRFTVKGGPAGVEFPPPSEDETPWVWAGAGPTISATDIRALSRLKQLGRDEEVRELLQRIDEQITGVELLAPSGTQANVFVRLKHEGLLPIQMMGEGVQRFFGFAMMLAGYDDPQVFIDEVENGLHHSVLEPLWNWIAEAAELRNTQIFATTHSEECVQAACRAFKARNDEGLRVIRLDKREHETKAVVYDRDLVEAAERMGVEIRG